MVDNERDSSPDKKSPIESKLTSSLDSSCRRPPRQIHKELPKMTGSLDSSFEKSSRGSSNDFSKKRNNQEFSSSNRASTEENDQSKRRKSNGSARRGDQGRYPNMIHMSVSKTTVEKKFSYISLPDAEDVFAERYSDLFERDDPDIEKIKANETKYVPQRSKLWYLLRNNCVTGSVMKDFLCFTHSLHKKRIGLGMVDNVDPVELYTNFLLGGQDEHKKIEPYTQSWVNVNWGSFHEFSAIYIYLEAVKFAQMGIEVLTPDMPDKWAESGLWILSEEKYNDLMSSFNNGQYVSFSAMPNIGASPDGLYPNIENPTVCFEIKCRSVYWEEKDGSFRRVISNHENGKGRPFTKIPTYYIPQIQMQMLVTGASKCVFISWTPSYGTNVFLVDKDIEYCQKMMHMIGMCTVEILASQESGQGPRREVFERSQLCEELLSLSEKISLGAQLYKLSKKEIINDSINVPEIGKDKFLDSKPKDIIEAFHDTDLILDLLDGKPTRFKVI